MKLNENKCCGTKLEWNKLHNITMIEHSNCESCGKNYLRKKDEFVYSIKKGKKTCMNCNESKVVDQRVIHTIHDKEISICSCEKMRIEYIPYCKICEEPENENGIQISSGDISKLNSSITD